MYTSPHLWSKPQKSASKSDLNPEKAGRRPLKRVPKLDQFVATFFAISGSNSGVQTKLRSLLCRVSARSFLGPVLRQFQGHYEEENIVIPYQTSLNIQGVAACKKAWKMDPPNWNSKSIENLKSIEIPKSIQQKSPNRFKTPNWNPKSIEIAKLKP